MKTEIKLDIQAQPDHQTCGPACLYSLYRYYGDDAITLKQVISQIKQLENGGTLAEFLGTHALKRGFDATIYTYHLQMFDPTWFADDGEAHDPGDMTARLKEQARTKPGDRRSKISTRAYLEFLRLGGRVRMQDLTPGLLRNYLADGVPILAGLSSTYLYRSARERGEGREIIEDDITGEPQGHFVMLVGYDSANREVLVADPLDPNPPFHTAKYRLDIDRLVNAVLLGILTYDANLLIITRRKRRRASGPKTRVRSEGNGKHGQSAPPPSSSTRKTARQARPSLPPR